MKCCLVKITFIFVLCTGITSKAADDPTTNKSINQATLDDFGRPKDKTYGVWDTIKLYPQQYTSCQELDSFF